MKIELRYIILILFIFLYTINNHGKAQTPSDDCSAAGAQQFTVGTSVSFNVGTPVGSPAPATCTGAAKDGWCWFTATGDKTTIKYIPNATGDAQIFIYSTPCASTAKLACIDAGGDGVTEILNYNTTSGTNYAVRIANWNSAAMTGILTIASSADNCAQAQTLTLSSSCSMNIATIGAATQSLAPCAGAGTVADVWFQFVATKTTASISAIAGFDVVIQMLSACGAGSLYCQNGGASGIEETINASGLTIGTTYYVRVYQFGGGSPADPCFVLTLPASISSFPYTENFETGTLPCGWNSSGAGTVRWVQNTWTGSAWLNTGSDGTPVTLDGMPTPSIAAGTTGPTSGTHCIWLNENGIGSNETEYLTTPVIDFTAITSSGGRPNLRFYYACGGTSSPTLTIQGSTDGGSTWGGDWGTAYLQCLSNSGSFGGGTTQWLLENIAIPAPYKTGANVKIRIKTVTSWVQPDLWVDDFVIENIGCSFDCVSPPALPANWSKTPAGSGWTNSIYDGVVNGNNYLPPSAVNIMVTSSAGAVWLFSPGLVLTGGVSYPFNFVYGMDPGSTGSMEVKYGTVASAAGMTSAAIFSDASISGTVMSCRFGTATITPASSGTYYLGWNAKTIAGGGNIYLDNIGIDGLISLPIELISFTAICTKGNVNMEWQVGTQTNNNYFSIERTTDGIDFETIGTVQGAGTTSQTMNYSFIDYNPPSGNFYYRLRQTDFDGKTEAFNLISVLCTDAPLTLHLKPNPANNELSITLSGKDDFTSISITDVIGQIVLTKNIPGNQEITINIEPLTNGIYFVSSPAAEIKPIKFIKQ